MITGLLHKQTPLFKTSIMRLHETLQSAFTKSSSISSSSTLIGSSLLSGSTTCSFPFLLLVLQESNNQKLPKMLKRYVVLHFTILCHQPITLPINVTKINNNINILKHLCYSFSHEQNNI